MENILNNLGLPVIWHKPGILLIWILLLWLVSRLIKSQLSKTKIGNDAQYKAKKAVTFATYALFLLIILITYSSSLGGLTVALGVAGAGIAFALQEVIASFAGWLALLFGGFYKPGDRVQLVE